MIKQMRASRQPIPEDILECAQEQKDIPTFIQFYLYAFEQLSTERSFGMGAGPIPYSKVEFFADGYGMSDYSRYKLHTIIRAVDNVFLQRINAEQQSKSKSK